MIGASARLRAGLFISAVVAAASLPAGAAPLASLERACDNLASKLRTVPAGECKSAGLNVANAASVQGQPILWRDYRSVKSKTPAKRVLLVGGIHGDELSSVAITFEWMRRLGDQEQQPFYWRVVPCLNPDGVLAPISRRANANGVDLNRNFPTPDWDAKAQLYWQTRTKSDPRRFPGKTAASEPETRWLIAQIKSFRPDAIVSIHAPYGVLDFDGPRTPPQKLGFLNLNELGTYPGSLGNYAGEFLGIPIITLELPHSEASPTVAQSGKIWSDLLRWLERNLPQGSPPLFQRLSDPNWLRNAP